METAANRTPKGQITAHHPLAHSGAEQVILRFEGQHATVPNFLDLAGVIHVPEAKRDIDWDEIRRQSRSDRSANQR